LGPGGPPPPPPPGPGGGGGRGSPPPPLLLRCHRRCTHNVYREMLRPRNVFLMLLRDTMQPTFDRVEAKLAFMWPLMRLWDRPVYDALQWCALVCATDCQRAVQG